MQRVERSAARFVVAIAVGWSLGAIPQGAAAKECGGATPCGCGDTIRADVTLGRAVGPCSGSGLRIAKDDLVLDCRGFAVLGRGDGDGILIDDAEGVEVTNCRVTGFRHGIRVREGRKNWIVRNELVGNDRYGIDLAARTTENLVQLNLVADSGDEGIHVGTGSDQNLIVRNEIRRSGLENLYLLAVDGPIVVGNVISGGRSAGIYAKHVTGAFVAENLVADRPIQVRGDSYANEFLRNDLVEAGWVFQAYDDPERGWTHPHGNLIRGGSVSGAATCFRFEGAYDNRVTDVAADDCRVVRSEARGGRSASGNVIDVD